MGYIVLFDRAVPQSLGGYDDTPPNGILLTDTAATLFPTRPKAKAAIARTNKYSVRYGMGWEDNYTIIPILNGHA